MASPNSFIFVNHMVFFVLTGKNRIYIKIKSNGQKRKS